MKKKVVQKKLKTALIYDWGSFPSHTFICIGLTHEEAIKWCKDRKNKISKEFTSWIEKDAHIKKSFSGNDGGVFTYGTGDYEGDKLSFSAIIVKDFEDVWTCWEILLHELHHAVYWITKFHALQDETEAQAYTYVQAFRTIRRKLQKID